MVDFPSTFFEGVWSTPTTQSTVSSAAEAVDAAADAVLIQANAAAASAAAAAASAVEAADAAADAATYSTASGNYEVFNITAATYGAIADAVSVETTATMASGSRVLTVGTPMFAVGDVGKLCSVSRMDVAHAISFSSLTITAFYSSTSVQLSSSPYLTVPPYGPVAGETCLVCVGTNNSPAIQAALDAVRTAGGGAVFIPPGRFAIGLSLKVPSNCRMFGLGPASEIVGCGAGWGNQPVTGYGPLIINDDAVANPQTSVSYDYSPSFRVDHDITFENFRITSDGAVPQTGKMISMSMAKHVRVLRMHFECGNMLSLTAFAGPGCEDVLIWECRGTNLGGGGAGAWDFWKGWRDIKIIGTVVSMRPLGAVQAINMNAIGSNYSDTENGDYFEIRGNRIELNGAPVSGGELVGIFLDGLRAGSPTARGIVEGNTIVGVSGARNLGIIARGNGGHLRITNNLLVNLGTNSSSQNAVIMLASVNDPGVNLTNPASVVNTSDVVTVTWANHGISALDLTNGMWVFVPNNFGGITFVATNNGFYPVLSVIDVNTFTFRAPSAATSTASGLGTGAWLFNAGWTHDNVVSGNIIIDPLRVGYAAIEIGGYNNICTGNIVSVTSGSPQYCSIVQAEGPNLGGPSGSLIADNYGPTGSGAAVGFTGTGRVAWRTGSPMPIIRDTDHTTGTTRHVSPVDLTTVTMAALQAGASYANDAAAAAGGVALGQVYRTGSALMIRMV